MPVYHSQDKHCHENFRFLTATSVLQKNKSLPKQQLCLKTTGTVFPEVYLKYEEMTMALTRDNIPRKS